MLDVVRYYTEQPEEGRLSSDWWALEFARTREIVARHLPAAPATILDVGGGTGVYAEWLCELGYRTHLVDLAPSHIAIARSKRKGLASAEVGDARRLQFRDASFDIVLLLGPLYHLTEREDRVAALREARRVVRPNGLVFAAAICRYAPLLGSLVEGFFDDPAFAPVLARDLVDGQHRNSTGDPRRFTTAYFHRPEELPEELRAAGLEPIECLAVEGPCWMANGSRSGFAGCWSDPQRRTALLDLARTVERDPLALAASPHLLAVGRRG
jgi:ubiquinone/menaquinone biosynthesis C-methylase UbiE